MVTTTYFAIAHFKLHHTPLAIEVQNNWACATYGYYDVFCDSEFQIATYPWHPFRFRIRMIVIIKQNNATCDISGDKDTLSCRKCCYALET